MSSPGAEGLRARASLLGLPRPALLLAAAIISVAAGASAYVLAFPFDAAAFGGLTVPAVLGAGFADGFNPCAFALLVLFGTYTLTLVNSVTADGRRGYTANIMDGSITEVDLAARSAPRRLAVATMTEGVAVTPDGGQVWVGSNDAHSVTVVDTRAWRAVDTIPGASTPYRVTIAPDGRVALVSYPRENAVRLFDTRTRAELATVPIPGPRAGEAAPLGSTVAADSRWAYVALAAQDAVAVVDLRAHAVLKYLETGPGPDGIAIVAAR